MSRPDLVGAALVLVAAFGFGTLGPLARFASEAGISALPFATWRAAVSALLLVLVVALLVRSGRSVLTRWRDVPRLERIQLAAMALATTGTTVSLFLAFERMSIALTLIIFYTYPSVVALAAVRLRHERSTLDRLAAIVLASTGMVLVVLAPQLESGALALDPIGVAFALLAAGCQVAYALVAARGFRSVPSLQAATLIRTEALGFYLVLVVPMIVFLGQGAELVGPATSTEAWALILLAASLGAALPAVTLVMGYRRIGSVRGAILMLFEPVVGVALAALLLGERPAPLQLLGGALVLVGAGLATLGPGARATALVEPSPTPSE